MKFAVAFAIPLLLLQATKPQLPIRRSVAKVVTPHEYLTLQIQGKGDISIELFTAGAPLTCQHIIQLVNSGFYNGQKFFRVITQPKPYLIQAGDPQTKTMAWNAPQVGTKGSGSTVPYEDSGNQLTEGAVALATKQNDRNSGDSQFFITLGDFHRLLDGTATVFGHVRSGMDVVHEIVPGDVIVKASVTSK